MKTKYISVVYIAILLLFNTTVIAQDNYTELRELVRGAKDDATKIKTIRYHLNQSVKKSDTINIANAYYILTSLQSTNKVTYEAYIDSIIALTKNKVYFQFLGIVYTEKANIKYEEGDYTEALEYLVKASELAKENGNDREYLENKFNIGIILNAADDRKKSQAIFAEYIGFLEQNSEYIDKYNYNPGLFALADAYIHTNNLDLAKTTIDKGIKQTLKTQDSTYYSYILVTSGIHQYLSNNYQKAIDSLQKGKQLIQKFDSLKTRIATCDYYIGKSHKDLGNKEESILYFKKVDTILRKTKDVIPEIIDVYTYLRADAKSNNNYELQIEYISTQLELDSIRHANQVYLTRNISRKYDTAELVSEKERLIEQHEKDTFLKNNTIILLIALAIILVFIALYGFRKNYINKKRFQKLLTQQKKPKVDPSEHLHKLKSDLIKKAAIDIPKDVIENILKKLQDFEDKNQFAKKHYTLNSLAKELHTNSAYLSKIINIYKNVNFTNYLNTLRIDFAIDQLRTNKSLRFYTIQAIAEEVGFKNAQSFSSAFHKKTGIYPSYFIKRIKS